MKKLMLIPSLLLTGCNTLPFLRKTPAELSTDPVVIAAVQHAKSMDRLVWMGGISIIAVVAFFFVSNNFLPKSSGLGIGLVIGGAACIGVSIFEPALSIVALPVTIISLVFAFAVVIYKLVIGRQIIKKKSLLAS